MLRSTADGPPKHIHGHTGNNSILLRETHPLLTPHCCSTWRSEKGKPFWGRVCAAGLRLIDSSEVPDSSVSREAAKQHFDVHQVAGEGPGPGAGEATQAL